MGALNFPFVALKNVIEGSFLKLSCYFVRKILVC